MDWRLFAELQPDGRYVLFTERTIKYWFPPAVYGPNGHGGDIVFRGDDARLLPAILAYGHLHSIGTGSEQLAHLSHYALQHNNMGPDGPIIPDAFERARPGLPAVWAGGEPSMGVRYPTALYTDDDSLVVSGGSLLRETKKPKRVRSFGVPITDNTMHPPFRLVNMHALRHDDRLYNARGQVSACQGMMEHVAFMLIAWPRTELELYTKPTGDMVPMEGFGDSSFVNVLSLHTTQFLGHVNRREMQAREWLDQGSAPSGAASSSARPKTDSQLHAETRSRSRQ